jgi:hypothetical protein
MISQPHLFLAAAVAAATKGVQPHFQPFLNAAAFSRISHAAAMPRNV